MPRVCHSHSPYRTPGTTSVLPIISGWTPPEHPVVQTSPDRATNCCSTASE